jgi:hypothetical protein
MPKQVEVGLVEGENINKRQTSQPRRRPRRMTKPITPRSRVFQTNLSIPGTAHAEALQIDPTLRTNDPAISVRASCFSTIMLPLNSFWPSPPSSAVASTAASKQRPRPFALPSRTYVRRAWLQVDDERFNSIEIQRLYEADEYPLRKSDRQA